ncbi:MULTISPECIES: hypothetical protein [Vibrio]|uniref:hypothetical protein n=1 Tax=Vibrio TaxID=662 RepID=UPI002074E717|nr:MULTISPECIES: hypothetical protein [Vibrio]MCX8827941.1 hypothetical protein [Vibrio parahaemolyticus]MCX8928691.1 hypothetical protein [Vibrio parahaemolyticus]USD75021.1 hypothetical protein J4N43_04855 [Vibrio sp. SCSIO 43009]
MNTNQKLTEARNLIDQVLNRNVGTIGHADLPAEALAQKQKLFSGQSTNREVLDIVNAINALAISNQDVIEIHTGFVANVNWFETIAYVKGCQYEPGANRLFQKRVRLDEEDAGTQLLAIESEITELVIEAREEAEAKAEVEA